MSNFYCHPGRVGGISRFGLIGQAAFAPPVVVPGRLRSEIPDLRVQRAHEFVHLTAGELFGFEYARFDLRETAGQIDQKVKQLLPAFLSKNSRDLGPRLRIPWRAGVYRFVVLPPVFFLVFRIVEQRKAEIVVLFEHGNRFFPFYLLGARQNHHHRMLAWSPLVGTGAEVLKVAFLSDMDPSGIPLAAGYPRDKGVLMSTGELIDPLHIALAPIEHRPARPLMQVIEGQFLQNGADGFHYLFLRK